MNKTKRKIFETSMKLFEEKGYEATSIEEITSIVGVAKGTLYYHFSSKEEIFNFLVEEGMKLLKNSIEIKIEKKEKCIDKIKAIVLIQIKILVKYEDFMTILFSHIWGKEPRNNMCRDYLAEYIDTIEAIIKEGIESGELIECNPEVVASAIFGLACSSLIYKQKSKKEIDIMEISKEIEKSILNGLTKKGK